MRRDFAWRLSALAIGLALGISPVCADMRVLGSNVARYPRDTIINGNTIGDLTGDDWVTVLMLGDNTTQLFGKPPPPPRVLGTRGLSPLGTSGTHN
jgi:hypothetical protein